MPKEQGKSHNISLKKISCSDDYFNRAIKSIILGLRDLSYEHLVVEEVSNNIEFIQTIFDERTLHRIEVKTRSNNFMSSKGYTKEQAVTVFYEACVERKPFESLSSFGNTWYDYQKERHYEIVAETFENKDLTPDEEALYLEALNYLVQERKRKWALKMLVDYYKKIGDEELVSLYTKLFKEEM